MIDTAISPLRQRMIEDMTTRGFAAQTQSGYLRSVRDFAPISAVRRTRRTRKIRGVISCICDPARCRRPA